MLWILLLVIHGVASQDSSVTFKTTIIDSPVDQIIWCGGSMVVTQDDDYVRQDDEVQKSIHKKILYVLSNKGILYRSTDYGFKWDNVTEMLISQFDLPVDYRIRDMHQSPADSNILYFMGTFNTKSFKTNNCGRLYMKFSHEPKMYGFKFNKMNSEVILAFQEKQCKTGMPGCKDQYKRQLYLSENAGGSWRMLLERVKDASWDKLVHYIEVPDQRIIVAHLGLDDALIVSLSDDYFVNKKVISSEAFGFYQTYSYLFLLVRPDELSKGYDMEVQPQSAEYVDPVEVVLPILDQNKHTFTVLDASSDQIFLSVSHHEDLPKLTNIYMSDAGDSASFTVSLLNNVRSEDSGLCDFQVVKGVEGVYIANIYDHQEVEKFKSRRHKSTTERESKQRSQFDRLDAYRKSVISFDRGGEWHPIKAPEFDARGESLNCNGDCSLHLRGKTSNKQIYSGNQSIGIIVASGNTGLYQSTKDDDFNTYLSRDGGHNWFQIIQGSHIYEIGDHGGLITFAQQDQQTNRILYTWDEGLTFDDIIFLPNFKIEVENIVTEPSNMEQKFLLYGRQSGQKLPGDQFAQLKGVLVAFDFTSLHQRVCSGQWDPAMQESDYEFWTPLNYQQEQCLFGRTLKYTRRRRDSRCFNPEDLEKQVIVAACDCTTEDWECDVGYSRQIGSQECVAMSAKVNKIPKVCKGTYLVTQGYKKLPGDLCKGGIDLGPKETPCPQIRVEQQVLPNINPTPIVEEVARWKYSQILLGLAAMMVMLVYRNQIKTYFMVIYAATRAQDSGNGYFPVSESDETIQSREEQEL